MLTSSTIIAPSMVQIFIVTAPTFVLLKVRFLCWHVQLQICTYIVLYLMNYLSNFEIFFNVTKHNPPSLLKVTLQAAIVYLFSVLVFVSVIHYYFIGRENKQKHLQLMILWTFRLSTNDVS
jgi:hypothetical protein